MTALSTLGRLVARRPVWTVAAWLVVAAGLFAAAQVLGAPTDNDVRLPGSDAQAGRDLLDAHASDADATTGLVVLHVERGRLDDPAYQAAVDRTAARITGLPHVVRVVPPSPALGSASADGRTGYLAVTLDVPNRGVDHALAESVDNAAAPAREAGIQAVSGGVLAQALDTADTSTSELLGLAVAAIVLLFAFRGVVAAAVPLATALLTLTCGISAIGLAGHLTNVPTVAASLATMIGIGVGIDYALFLVTRYRELLGAGTPVPEAVALSVAGSGTAIVFAGGTVVVALGGLAIAGVPILGTLAWCCGLVVVFAVAGAVTLLPALLVLLGPRVNALRMGRGRAGDSSAGWARQADRVTRRPWLYVVGTTLLLVALAAPTLGLRLGQIDAGDNPAGTASRTSFQLLGDAFGPGVNGPLTVVAAVDGQPAGPSDPRSAALTSALTNTRGVARVAPAVPSADGTLVTAVVYATTSPSDPATGDLVRAIRGTRVDGLRLHVTGPTAARDDLAVRIGHRMPAVLGVVVGLAALLLFAAFRAPVVALKAAVMNLVSIGAAYGALTAVFAWGWGTVVTRLPGPVPVESYLPMMLFALLFGLSMDYEVFLLTAVRESWQATGDNRASVREGLARTGRVITSAALIMVCVFASFVLHTDPVIKMFGFGMAVAIAVDATIVRALLVPATMTLLGSANWWTPWRSRTSRPSQTLPIRRPEESGDDRGDLVRPFQQEQVTAAGHDVQPGVRDEPVEQPAVEQRDDRVVVTGEHQRRLP
jgi:RND superfamily putative drug exporter